jgi:hypothetical protein
LYKKLHQQNVRHRQDQNAWNELLKEKEGLLAETRSITNFRQYYTRWIKTEEGKAVKAKLFTTQNGQCFKCRGTLLGKGEDGSAIEHSEVHHLAPLALLQKYADAHPEVELSELQVFVTTELYLRLVHPKCNKQLGEMVGNLPDLNFLHDFIQEIR